MQWGTVGFWQGALAVDVMVKPCLGTLQNFWSQFVCFEVAVGFFFMFCFLYFFLRSRLKEATPPTVTWLRFAPGI